MSNSSRHPPRGARKRKTAVPLICHAPKHRVQTVEQPGELRLDAEKKKTVRTHYPARGPNGLRPATDRARPYGKPGKSLRSASNSTFIRGIPVRREWHRNDCLCRTRPTIAHDLPPADNPLSSQVWLPGTASLSILGSVTVSRTLPDREEHGCALRPIPDALCLSGVIR